MKTKILSISFLLLLIGTIGKAQDESKDPVSNGFRVYCESFSLSWYQPKMDYWNDTYLPTLGVTETFGGNIAIGGNITFALPFDLRTRVGMSYWSEKVKGKNNLTINSLQVGFTRFRLGVLYAPKSVSFIGFQPYLGIEGQFYLINNKLNNGTETSEQQGQDYSFVPLIGIDRSFGHFVVGAEFMYNLGSYIQDISDGIAIKEQKVSLTGQEVAVSVGYKF
jgi:hypothetical protein